ncbi:hypothetical protein B0H14DRAFT_3539084 [Mycena olivaceomarginata]|nr:hypothetical protein B0H14DRAFT_3539084 [Mycena olivaceomarginata]
MHTPALCLLLALLGTIESSHKGELLASLIRTHARYGSTEPLERRQSELSIGFTEGVNVTTKAPSASYYISLGFGGPVQSINVLLDTASSDIVVAGATCTDNCHTTVALYDSGKFHPTAAVTHLAIPYGLISRIGPTVAPALAPSRQCFPRLQTSAAPTPDMAPLETK